MVQTVLKCALEFGYKGSDPSKLDPKIFQEMNATCIVTLVGSPVEILDRRKYDRSRVRPERSLEQIENYQREAILHASLISWELGIPVINIPVRNTDILDLLISQ